MIRKWVLGYILPLAFTVHLGAQPQWEVTIEPINGSHSETHCAYLLDDGRIVLLVTERSVGPLSAPSTGSRIVVLESNGTVSANEEVVVENHHLLLWGFLGQNAEGEHLLYGMLGSVETPLEQLAIIRLDSTWLPIDIRPITPAGHPVANVMAHRGVDDVIRMAFQQSASSDPLDAQYIQALAVTLEGDSITGRELVHTLSTPSIGSLHPHPDGRLVLSTGAVAWDAPPSNGHVVYLSDTFDLLGVYPTEQVEEGSPMNLVNAPGGPLDILPLPSGDLLISGYYWHSPFVRRTAIQRTNDQGQVQAQWAVTTPFAKDQPAPHVGISLGTDGILYHAQVNTDGGLTIPYWSNSPGQAQVFRMDTSLNILGSYTFDGIAQNSFYWPISVMAMPDGGVLVMGALRESMASGTIVGWVARFGPEDFLSVSEMEQPAVQVFPNPGMESFHVMLTRPLAQGRLRLHDMQGRLVLATALTGMAMHIPTTELASGLYALTITDGAGRIVHAGRWVKE